MSKSKTISQDSLKVLLRKFDKDFSKQLDSMYTRLQLACSRNETKLRKCEETLKGYVQWTKDKTETELSLAQSLVEKELRTKVIMSSWTSKFVSETEIPQLDPITFAFTRFSLNICLCFGTVPPEYFLKTKVHEQLLQYIKLDSPIVVGPAIMGLVHLSVYEQLKAEIVAIGALPVLVNLLISSNSRLVLNQICKLIASLSLHYPNKSLIVSSGCLHGAIDLILGNSKEVDDNIRYHAICSMVNLTNGNDANRNLCVEINGIKPLISTLISTSNHHITLQCVRSLGNIAFCNTYTSGIILTLGGVRALMDCLAATDIFRNPLLCRTIFATLANLCCEEGQQSHVGSNEGLIKTVLRVLDSARDIYLITDAALLVLALGWKNEANKFRLAHEGGVTSLLKRIIRHVPIPSPSNPQTFPSKLGPMRSIKEEEEEEAVYCCVEAQCASLASLLLPHPNHDKMTAIGGLSEIVRLSKTVTQPRLLRALSSVIVSMVPSPDVLYVRLVGVGYNNYWERILKSNK